MVGFSCENNKPGTVTGARRWIQVTMNRYPEDDAIEKGQELRSTS